MRMTKLPFLMICGHSLRLDLPLRGVAAYLDSTYTTSLLYPLLLSTYSVPVTMITNHVCMCDMYNRAAKRS